MRRVSRALTRRERGSSARRAAVRKNCAERAPHVVLRGDARHAERQVLRAAARGTAPPSRSRAAKVRVRRPDLDEAGVVERLAQLAQRGGGAARGRRRGSRRRRRRTDTRCSGRVVARRASARRPSLNALEDTVPPLPVVWKNWLSLNSQASAAWAMNAISTLAYWRRMPCSAKKKNVLASWRSASPMLPETSSAKITAALVAGVGRCTSWRKRRSSSVNGAGFGLDRAAPDRLLHGAAAVEARARAALVPAFAHVVGRRPCVAAALGLADRAA